MFQQNRSPYTQQYTPSSLSASTTYTNDYLRSIDQLLVQYRKQKPNSNLQMKKEVKKQSFLPEILCRILLKQSNDLKAQQINSRCQCPKNQDGLCKLVMNWIDQNYFWKNDPHFKRTYDHYTRKKNEDWAIDQMYERIEEKLQILGIQLARQEILSLAEILLNFEKHIRYYGKEESQLKQTDFYIWVGLGISYHIGFSSKQKYPQIIFWAIQIIVDKIGCLNRRSMIEQHQKLMKRFDHYFLKWHELLTLKGINLNQIVWEWLNEMMFGYMGIQSIGFFLDCFLKAGWDYLFKVCLSYFEHRINDIRRNSNFLKGQIQRQEILKLILDSNEEWPMIFCTASSFNYKEQ